MMKILRCLVVCALLQVVSWAQSPALLEITGDVSHGRVFQEQEWKDLKHVTISATNAHDKKTATYSGVPLRQLLHDAGVPSGENLRGKAMSTVIVVTAADGYRVVFSIAELDESLGNLDVLLADAENDKPLDAATGPLRLIVPADKRPARWVRMVRSIRVVTNP